MSICVVVDTGESQDDGHGCALDDKQGHGEDGVNCVSID